MELTETTLESELKYKGKVIDVYSDTALLENGCEAKRDVVRHPGGVWWNSADAPDAFYLRNGFRHLAFYKAVKNRFGYDNPCAVDLAANTIAAELRAGHVDRAVETLKAYPDYACKALGVIAERDRLERELARSRRRLKRVIWAAAIAVALVLLALFA